MRNLFPVFLSSRARRSNPGPLQGLSAGLWMASALMGLAMTVFFSKGSFAAEIYEVQPEKMADLKAVIATVESVREVQARARISGTLSLLAVKEGDRVSAGDTIALVGDPKLTIKAQGLEAGIQAAQSAYDKAKLDFSRAKDLRESGYGTQARLDEARAALEIAENNLQAARSGKQEVAQQATEGAVLAPSAGRVLKVPVSRGAVVMAGETIAVLSQENYVLRIELPERHARFLKEGDTVLVGARGMGGDGKEGLQAGTVRLVYPEIKNGRVMADVTVAGLGDYFVGERTLAYVSAGDREALTVPAAALYRRAGIDYVKLEDGREIVVRKGLPRGGKVEILAGLRDGDRVVLP